MEAKCSACQSVFTVHAPGAHICPTCGSEVLVAPDAPISPYAPPPQAPSTAPTSPENLIPVSPYAPRPLEPQAKTLLDVPIPRLDALASEPVRTRLPPVDLHSGPGAGIPLPPIAPHPESNAPSFGGGPGGTFGGWPPPPGGPPPPPPPSSPGGQEDTPWERRRQLGIFSGFFEQVKRTLTAPGEFWPSVKALNPWVDALIFAWIILAAYALLQTPIEVMATHWIAGPLGRWLDAMPNLSEENRRAIEENLRDRTPLVSLFSASARVILAPLLLIAQAGILHLMCLLVGAAKNGFGATARALFYATPPLLFAWIPCLNLLALVYFVALIVWGISRLQEVSTGRAVLAVSLIWLVICCCCCPVGVMFSGMARTLSQSFGEGFST